MGAGTNSRFNDGTAYGLSLSEVSVSPGTNRIANILNANSNPKKTLVLDPGVYVEDMTTWPATPGLFVVRGSGTGLLDSTAAQTAAALESGQSVIQPSKVPAAANNVAMNDTGWERLVFDLSQVAASSAKAFFFGSNNVRNYLDKYSVLNALAQMAINGDHYRLYHGVHTTSSDAPANTLAGGWKVMTNLYADDILNDGNYTGATNASLFGVDGFSTALAGRTLGLWRFNGIRQFPSNQFFVDAGWDFEFGSATAGPRCEIIGGEMWNSKIYDVGVPYLYIGGGFKHRVTSVTNVAGPAMVIDAGTGGTPSTGILDIKGALSWYDDNAANIGCKPIQFSNLNYIREINIDGLDLILNGASTAAGTEANIPIYAVAPATVGATYLDRFYANNIRVSYTSLPATAHPTIKIGAQAASTIKSVELGPSSLKYLGTQSAAAGLPAGVNGAVVTNPLLLGFAAIANTISSLTVDGIDTLSVAPTTPTPATPTLVSSAGTLTVTKEYYGPRNKPGLQNRLLAQTGPLAAPNVLNYLPLADGTFDVAAYISVTAWTTPAASQVTVTYKDENGTTRTPELAVRTIGAAEALNFNSINPWYARPMRIRAQAGTGIQFATTVLTGTPTYDIIPSIVQVPE